MDYERLELYVDGDWKSAIEAGSETILNPATGEVLGVLPHASDATLDRCLASAKRGFQRWRTSSIEERAEILSRVSDLMRAGVDRLARIITLEQGKPLREATMEVLSSADRFDWFAAEAARIAGRILPGQTSSFTQQVSFEPVGVVLGLSPWNSPIALPGSQIGSAIASGCAIIVKPAESTPGSAIALVRLFEEAGLPPGVLNLVFGNPAHISSYLIASPVVRKVSFTGSIDVGKLLYRQCAEGMKKMTLELGGHAPVIVCGDVDASEVAKIVAGSKYRNAGQTCASPTRILVNDRVADALIEGFARHADGLRVGNGLDSDVEMGPLMSQRRVMAMDSLVEDARASGAKLISGGERGDPVGNFWMPTVVADVPASAKIMNSEPFGPIAIINRWSDLDEALDEANRLPLGLAAYVFTTSAETGASLAKELHAGVVGVNSMMVAGPDVPWGGVGDSGIGRDGGTEGLMEYFVSKTIARAA